MDIKELRKELNLTQQELADRCGVTLRTVQNWEMGKKIPDSAMLLLDRLTKNESVSHPGVIMIPVINLDARGGFGTNDIVDTPATVIDTTPFSRRIAKEGDIAIPVYGDSMSPLYPAGSMILIRNVQMWKEYLEYGATYVLELQDGRRLIKTIKHSEVQGRYILESVNPSYEPAEIPKSMIKNVFRVLMCVRRESL